MDNSDEEFEKEFSPNSRDKYYSSCSKNITLHKVFGNKIFKSDDELNKFIVKHQNDEKKNYFRRDTQPKNKISNHVRLNANDNLKYRYIKFECVHGFDRESKSKGVRTTLLVQYCLTIICSQ